MIEHLSNIFKKVFNNEETVTFALIIIIALVAFVSILLSLYNGNPNWKIYLLGTMIFFIILYISISYEKNQNK